MTFSELPRLFTIDEVSTVTRAPRSTVQFWIYSGQLRSLKVGRRRLVSDQALLAFLRRCAERQTVK